MTETTSSMNVHSSTPETGQQLAPNFLPHAYQILLESGNNMDINISSNGSTPLQLFDPTKLIFYDRVQTVPLLIYIFILFLIGVPGNLFVCYIYYAKLKKKTSRIFIIALACFDLINNLVSLPVEVALLLNFYNFDIPWLCKSSRFVAFAMNSASSTVLTGIAVDRLMGICYWSTVRPMTIQTAKTIVAFAVFFGFVTSWPAILIYGTFTIGSTGMTTCLYDDEYKNSVYSTIFAWYVLVSNCVYDVLLITLYSIIGKHIFTASHIRSTFKGSTTTLDQKNQIFLTKRQPSVQSTSAVNEEEILFFRKSPSSSSGNLNKFSWLSPHRQQIAGSVGDLQSTKNKVGLLVRSNSYGGARQLSTLHLKRSFSTKSEGYIINRRYKPGKTTTMLFLVTVAFILSFVPYCVISILRLGNVLQSLLNNTSVAGQIIFHLFLRSYLMSSCLNPLIYNGLNKQFKFECKNLIKNIMMCFVCKRSEMQTAKQ